MSAEMQADCAAGLGQGISDVFVLSQFTNTLKVDFMGILAGALATEETSWVQCAADLCAERCQEMLLKEIDRSSGLGAALVQALKLPSAEVMKRPPAGKIKAAGSECTSCAFFDLTDDDGPDDVSTCASSSRSVSDMDLDLDEDGSIEFMFGEGLLTINFNKLTGMDLDVDNDDALQKDIHVVTVPQDDRARLSWSATARPVGRKLSRKDLLSLYQDIKHLRKDFEDTRTSPSAISGTRTGPSAISGSGYPKSFRALHATQKYLSMEARRTGQVA